MLHTNRLADLDKKSIIVHIEQVTSVRTQPETTPEKKTV